jgi:hypothetical protein
MNARKKNPAAVSLGRRGGSIKTAKGLAKMSKKRRMEIVRLAVAARKAKKEGR